MKLVTIKGTPMKMLLEPEYFRYWWQTIKIPAWFSFDGLSIPRLMQWLVDMNSSDNIIAWLIHDWFYSFLSWKEVSRFDSDFDLYERLDFPPNVLVFIWLRLWWWVAWKKDKNYKKYKKQIERARIENWLDKNIS